MPLQYGLNITKSDMQKMLEQNDKQQNGIRTWRSLFGNAGLGANAQSDAITSQYTDAIAQAYKANFEQQNAVQNSGLGAGAVKDYLALTRQELQNTYNNYLSNYASDINDVQESYNNEVGVISNELGNRAQNFADLYNSAYEYLSSELFSANAAIDDWENATPIVEGEGSKDPKVTGYAPGTKTLNYLTEHDLDWLKDKNGKLRSWNELSSDILNPDGTFTDRGKNFFDQMFNATSAELSDFTRTDEEGNEYRVRGFDEWLSENNSKLRDWWASGDAYNYNFAGSNAGSAKAYAGLDSTDMKAARLPSQIGVGGEGSKSSKLNPLFKRGKVDIDYLNTTLKDIKMYRDNEVARVQRELDQLTEDYNSRRLSGGLNADYERDWRQKYSSKSSELEQMKRKLSGQIQGISTYMKDLATEAVNAFGADADAGITKDLLAEFQERINSLVTTDIDAGFPKLMVEYEKLMNDIEAWIKNYKRKLPDNQSASGF